MVQVKICFRKKTFKHKSALGTKKVGVIPHSFLPIRYKTGPKIRHAAYIEIELSKAL